MIGGRSGVLSCVEDWFAAVLAEELLNEGALAACCSVAGVGCGEPAKSLSSFDAMAVARGIGALTGTREPRSWDAAAVEGCKRPSGRTEASVFLEDRNCSLNDGGVDAADGVEEGDGELVKPVSAGTPVPAFAPPIMAVLDAAAAGVDGAEAAGVFDAATGDALLMVPAEDSGVAAISSIFGTGVDAKPPAADSVEDGDGGSSFATDGDGSSFGRRCSK